MSAHTNRLKSDCHKLPRSTVQLVAAESKSIYLFHLVSIVIIRKNEKNFDDNIISRLILFSKFIFIVWANYINTRINHCDSLFLFKKFIHT